VAQTGVVHWIAPHVEALRQRDTLEDHPSPDDRAAAGRDVHGVARPLELRRPGDRALRGVAPDPGVGRQRRRGIHRRHGRHGAGQADSDPAHEVVPPDLVVGVVPLRRQRRARGPERPVIDGPVIADAGRHRRRDCGEDRRTDHAPVAPHRFPPPLRPRPRPDGTPKREPCRGGRAAILAGPLAAHRPARRAEATTLLRRRDVGSPGSGWCSPQLVDARSRGGSGTVGRDRRSAAARRAAAPC
jgi:hypothetical protein